MTRPASAATLLVALAFASAAQKPATFEVGSVKRATTNRYVPPIAGPQRFRNVANLHDAIVWAYRIHDYQRSGGPAWINRDYYEIQGTSAAPATEAEMRTMLQALLADRFQLKVHRESKVMSVYALTIGKSAPKLQSSRDACGPDGCINVAPGQLNARYATMRDTAATLSHMVDRPVLDQTGLNGRYDFRVKFDPTFQKPYEDQPIVRPGADQASIFTVIEELGLKLEPRRASVEILVIDRAVQPSAN